MFRPNPPEMASKTGFSALRISFPPRSIPLSSSSNREACANLHHRLSSFTLVNVQKLCVPGECGNKSLLLCCLREPQMGADAERVPRRCSPSVFWESRDLAVFRCSVTPVFEIRYIACDPIAECTVRNESARICPGVVFLDG